MSDSPQESRYSRQSRFAPLGEAGQRKIRAARVAVVGVGALGSVETATGRGLTQGAGAVILGSFCSFAPRAGGRSPRRSVPAGRSHQLPEAKGRPSSGEPAAWSRGLAVRSWVRFVVLLRRLTGGVLGSFCSFGGGPGACRLGSFCILRGSCGQPAAGAFGWVYGSSASSSRF